MELVEQIDILVLADVFPFFLGKRVLFISVQSACRARRMFIDNPFFLRTPGNIRLLPPCPQQREWGQETSKNLSRVAHLLDKYYLMAYSTEESNVH